MSLSFKTIMFCIVLGIFLPTAYFMDYKDGHREVEAVKARYEQADKDTAESVKNPSISSIRTVRSVLTQRCMILRRDNLSTVGRAGAIGAEYDCGVHNHPPGCARGHAKRRRNSRHLLIQNISFLHEFLP